MRLACVIVLVGCGRLGFETAGDGATGGEDDGGSGSDAALIDGPPNNPDAMDIVVTLGEDPMADVNGVTADTYLSQDEGPSLNFGGADELRIERDKSERALIRFALDAVPSGTVLSARLRFTIETAAAGSIVTFREVLEAWIEGSGDGDAGVANYMFRQSLIPWSLPGAGAPASIGPALGTFAGDTLGPIEVVLPASLVQGWVDAPTENFGILLESNSDGTVRLVSSEGDSNQRPVLSITYE